MNDNKNGAGAVILLAALMVPATAAFAQAVPTPQDTARTIPGLVIATPTPTPVPIPTGPVRGLSLPAPGPTPTAAAPVVPAVRAPARTPAPSPHDLEPSVRTPVAPVPEPAPTTIAPLAEPAIVPMPTPGAPPVSATPAASHAGERPDRTLWFLLGIGAIALLVAAGWAWRRHRSKAMKDVEAEQVPSNPPPPAAIAAPLPPSGPRAGIAVALRPIRAGLNLLSATVEAEVVVTNTGDAPATQVRIHATLLSAHAAQEADLAAVFATPAGRPATSPFALAPGEDRRVRVVVALAREAVRSMAAGGRPMFVPLVAVDVRYGADAAGTPACTGQAFVVGVERVDSAKLAPFWLDGPSRMHDQIAARPHGAVIEG